ncbi:hypothetical protein [Mesoplasma florum]|uniref:Uncharacterized protein n=1 Tax=Mesoplasma florum TaxID=2151 RepID=A0A2R3P7S5_MESFO|nr:hypothetical protein [Mesoplasma florum]AVN64511.1 hypothetical protein CG003_02455 [Mesoplasma florum]
MGINGDNDLAFWDTKNNFNRYFNTNILKDNKTNIFNNKKIDYNYLNKNSQNWKTTLIKASMN